MTAYEVLEIGAQDDWRAHHGGFRPDSSRDGRRVVDHDLAMQYIGLTANALEPGEQAGYWHTHSRIEELYVFLSGRGQMGLDDEVVEVGPGTVVRVGQDVARTWRCAPDGTEQLRWLCIRGRLRAAAPARRLGAPAREADALVVRAVGATRAA